MRFEGSSECHSPRSWRLGLGIHRFGSGAWQAIFICRNLPAALFTLLWLLNYSCHTHILEEKGRETEERGRKEGKEKRKEGKKKEERKEGKGKERETK